MAARGGPGPGLSGPSGSGTHALTFVTCLAADLLPLHRALAGAIARATGRPVTVARRSRSDGPLQGDVVTLCAPAYVREADAGRLIAVAAPVLDDPDLPDEPVYVSDVVVRADDPAHTLEDLHGRRWVYNERASLSGYGVVRDHLRDAGLGLDVFASAERVGSHRRALHAIVDGSADLAAVDRHVLAYERRRDPDLAAATRVLCTLGPNPIQPIAVSTALSPNLAATVSAAVATFDDAVTLHEVGVRRMARVDDATYDEVRVREAAASAP